MPDVMDVDRHLESRPATYGLRRYVEATLQPARTSHATQGRKCQSRSSPARSII